MPYDVRVRSVFVEGLLRQKLLDELRANYHDELILGHRLGSRDLARVRGVAPRLKVVLF